VDGEGFLSSQSKAVCIFALGELEGEDAHTDEIRPVDSFIGLSNNCFNSK
jgi:hypothetical protein